MPQADAGHDDHEEERPEDEYPVYVEDRYVGEDDVGYGRRSALGCVYGREIIEDERSPQENDTHGDGYAETLVVDGGGVTLSDGCDGRLHRS